MVRKKYIIIGIAVVVLIVVSILFSQNSSTPDLSISILEKGVKNLTRESAAKMIKKRLTANPQGWWYGWYKGKTQEFKYDERGGHYKSQQWTAGISKAKMKELETAGFIKIVAIDERHVESVFHEVTFDFTEQANPYFVKQENVSAEDKNVLLLLGEVVSVEVTGLTEGENQRIANYTARYKATPIGEIIDKKEANEEINSTWQFTLYDDGWREN